MKNIEVKINALKFENGDMIIGVDNGKYYVKTKNGILCYNEKEILEIYDFTDKG